MSTMYSNDALQTHALCFTRASIVLELKFVDVDRFLSVVIDVAIGVAVHLLWTSMPISEPDHGCESTASVQLGKVQALAQLWVLEQILQDRQ